MSMSTLPVHPATGLQALGFGKRGPIWPVVGASEDPPNPEDPTPDPDEPLGEAGKKALKSERDARAASDAKVKDLQRQLDAANQKLNAAKSGDQPEWQQKLDDLQAKLDDEIGARTKAEQVAADATLQRHRVKRAGLKGLSTEQAEKLAPTLSGKTDEEIDAEIDEWIPLLGTSGPQPNPQQGNPSKGRGGSLASGRERYAESKK